MRHRLALGSVALALSAVLLPAALPATAHAQSAVGHPELPGPGQLFVGTCYQPVDRFRRGADAMNPSNKIREQWLEDQGK